MRSQLSSLPPTAGRQEVAVHASLGRTWIRLFSRHARMTADCEAHDLIALAVEFLEGPLEQEIKDASDACWTFEVKPLQASHSEHRFCSGDTRRANQKQQTTPFAQCNQAIVKQPCRWATSSSCKEGMSMSQQHPWCQMLKKSS